MGNKISMKISAKVQRAFEVAKETRKMSYSPYSKFKVGAGIVTDSGKVFGGCNIENASYGGTVCAERVAILKAVSDGAAKVRDVVVVTDAKEPAVPCALCLQTMAEFCEPSAMVWIADTREILLGLPFVDLLPKPFGPKQLKAAL
jgi:cytidine deaminase